MQQVDSANRCNPCRCILYQRPTSIRLASPADAQEPTTMTTSSSLSKCTKGATRREFLQTSIATGATLAIGSGLVGTSAAHAQQRTLETGAKPAGGGKMKILILGGTGFLGPAIVDAARTRGHAITIFNRGKTDKRAQRDVGDV